MRVRRLSEELGLYLSPDPCLSGTISEQELSPSPRGLAQRGILDLGLALGVGLGVGLGVELGVGLGVDHSAVAGHVRGAIDA